MESLELACLSLECGDDRVSSSLSDDYEASLSFSENSDSSIDGYNFINCENEEVFDSKRVLTLVKTECSVDIQSDVLDFNLLLGTAERDCRICHLSLQKGGSDIESGTAIQLGCSCKNDLAAAHQDCAETWFRIKGNRICEICKSIAQNVVASDHMEPPQQASEALTLSENAASAPVSSNIVTPSFSYGHLLLDSMFACMVFAVFLIWIFHFHMAV
ncbi:hypothetical protein DCAR_0313775 [Daucus carota subsp. sativus]|uniref:Uncharacterized protein n=2 Tax=Daucus carota subsp. sativus TaxID=79200 RepID=A0A166C7P3_DAUCS|nr:hypothetical protein DCAR_0313775 [Daucus carota subsp. sativus]